MEISTIARENNLWFVTCYMSLAFHDHYQNFDHLLYFYKINGEKPRLSEKFDVGRDGKIFEKP